MRASISSFPILEIWIHNRWFVYYRITKAKVQSDKFEEAMATMESLRESIGKIDGLVSSNLVRISETEMIGVAAYESKEHLEASQEEFNELMANMMPYMAGAPEVSFGEGIFSFKSWASIRPLDKLILRFRGVQLGGGGEHPGALSGLPTQSDDNEEITVQWNLVTFIPIANEL